MFELLIQAFVIVTCLSFDLLSHFLFFK